MGSSQNTNKMGWDTGGENSCHHQVALDGEKRAKTQANEVSRKITKGGVEGGKRRKRGEMTILKMKMERPN